VTDSGVAYCPESPFRACGPNFAIASFFQQTFPATLDTGRCIIVLHMLSFQGWVAHNLSIVMFAVGVCAFGSSGGETILIVQLGVFEAFVYFMAIATTQ